jgi:dihydrofolate synthase/folylpolyglutamate synthase
VQVIRFFDIITIMAFLEFKEQGCEYVVLECGLGGRLDATNIIKPPICAITSSIGFDHMEKLGNTLPEIAGEKAMIIKPGTKGVVLGPTCC